ncbi:MAG: ribbon-helix-helix protein, CopG family [Hyphomicrobiaceae bacterium]|nr:MAG: ribbon-helix-helix protein, CopG family [Hyphomicrobiaceae bacterium]
MPLNLRLCDDDSDLRHTCAAERDRRLEVRVSATELAGIQRRAADTNRSVSDFVRASALDKPITIKTYNRLDLADLAQIKRLGNLLNQIAATMHANRIDGGTALLLHSVLDEIKVIVRREVRSPQTRGR